MNYSFSWVNFAECLALAFLGVSLLLIAILRKSVKKD